MEWCWLNLESLEPPVHPGAPKPVLPLPLLPQNHQTQLLKPAFAPFHLPTPYPIPQSLSLPTTYLLLHSFQYHPPLSPLNSSPFPCHISPVKYRQGSNLFLLCSSTVPYVFWPQRGSPLAYQHCPLITTLRILVPYA